MTARDDPRLGIDIGRVIIDGPADGHDTEFFLGDEAAMLATPEVDGAVAAIARLVTTFDGRVWLVSKCGPRVQARTERWLEAHDFFTRTQLAAGHVRFCRTRPDKRPICAELSLTHFVDDHPEVHEAIRDTVEHRYLFGPQHGRRPEATVHVRDWHETLRAILATLRG